MVVVPDYRPTEIFCSYSHADADYREDMKKSLALLMQDGTAQIWTDQEIVPGHSLSKEIYERMDRTHIFVFLLSPDFLDSQACIEEWEYARTKARTGHPVSRIPIVIRQCPWKEFLDKYDEDLLALPQDGKPVSTFVNKDEAWYQVYQGIAKVITELRSAYVSKPEFLNSINTTEFISDKNIRLEDIYIFPRLIATNAAENNQRRSTTISTDENGLLATDFALIHGDVKSGKSSLAKHIYMWLIARERPVLLLTPPPPGKQLRRFIADEFNQQYSGDFSEWLKLPDKTLIIDRIPVSKRGIDLLDIARELFDRVILIIPTETYLTMFFDDTRLTDFKRFEIACLSLSQQEDLIRRRLALLADGRPLTDGYIDQIEKDINSIIISDRIVPRYPFYVLSVLQTQETYMPSNMAITSYVHCYYALILAKIIQAGVSNADDEINACFNFASHLAYATYLHKLCEQNQNFDFDAFLDDYNSRYIIRNSIINRLKHPEFGIIDEHGTFRAEYIYYYMLGKYLASNHAIAAPIIASLCSSTHQEDSCLTLLFTIHHTDDSGIIDDLLENARTVLEGINSATLSQDETKRFTDILARLPDTVLSKPQSTEEMSVSAC